MGKIRINDLARELEVKSKSILDVLPEVGVTEKKSHSSSLEDHEADKVRARLRATSSAPSSTRSARPGRPDGDEIKTKIDLSNISKPGDALKAIISKQQGTATPDAPSPIAAPPAKPAVTAAPPAAAPVAKAPIATPPAAPPPAPPRLVVPTTTPRPTFTAPAPPAPPQAAAPVAPSAPVTPRPAVPPVATPSATSSTSVAVPPRPAAPPAQPPTMAARPVAPSAPRRLPRLCRE